MEKGNLQLSFIFTAQFISKSKVCFQQRFSHENIIFITNFHNFYQTSTKGVAINVKDQIDKKEFYVNENIFVVKCTLVCGDYEGFT